jgi:hypothetical protein
MRIAILGWGSLIWDPRDLPISGPWQCGGSVIPIEFSRISENGLSAPHTPAFWQAVSPGVLTNIVGLLSNTTMGSDGYGERALTRTHSGKPVNFGVADRWASGIVFAELNLCRTGSFRRQILWPPRASGVAAVVFQPNHANILR